MDENRKRRIFITSYVFVLAIVSLYIVGNGANGEPYLEFHPVDAILQVGIAIALMVLWLQFAGWLIYRIVTHRLASSWLSLTILVAIALFYLWDCPVGYIGDLARYIH